MAVNQIPSGSLTAPPRATLTCGQALSIVVWPSKKLNDLQVASLFVELTHAARFSEHGMNQLKLYLCAPVAQGVIMLACRRVLTQVRLAQSKTLKSTTEPSKTPSCTCPFPLLESCRQGVTPDLMLTQNHLPISCAVPLHFLATFV
ncbi:hypothetical protein [Falsirhodobacter sp. 1013]|uniref:hypothetical protein n=1 Tax=Falsirhodobacter sp. 1013 TaxID=3417566 RepID=UPI003EBB2688